jgi:hypothetical protein
MRYLEQVGWIMLIVRTFPGASSAPYLSLLWEREKLVVVGYGRERLYTREIAKALAKEITRESLTTMFYHYKLTPPHQSFEQEMAIYKGLEYHEQITKRCMGNCHPHDA